MWTFDFADGVNRLFAHSCAYALSWGPNAVVAAGADRGVCFYDALGDEYAASRPNFDYSDDETPGCIRQLLSRG